MTKIFLEKFLKGAGLDFFEKIFFFFKKIFKKIFLEGAILDDVITGSATSNDHRSKGDFLQKSFPSCHRSKGADSAGFGDLAGFGTLKNHRSKGDLVAQRGGFHRKISPVAIAQKVPNPAKNCTTNAYCLPGWN